MPDLSTQSMPVHVIKNDVARAFAAAFTVDPLEVARYQPTPEATKLGEAIATGLVNLQALVTATGLPRDTVVGLMNDPVVMLWISQRIESLFRYRAGLVDAALFMRAVAGDVTAIKLFFERHKILTDQKTLNVHYSGGVDVRGLPTDELRKIVADKARMLPAEFRLLSESKPTVDKNGSGTPGA